MQADRMAIGFPAAGIAHEINNPLTSIAGFSEGLLKRLKKMPASADENALDFFREYLDIIQSEVVMLCNGRGPVEHISSNIFNPARLSEDIGETHTIDLSICYSIMHHHKGEIEFKADGDDGSKFIIRFPVHPA